jgi:hypothetical protein
MLVCLRTATSVQTPPGSGIYQSPPNAALEVYIASELTRLKVELIFFYRN